MEAYRPTPEELAIYAEYSAQLSASVNDYIRQYGMPRYIPFQDISEGVSDPIGAGGVPIGTDAFTAESLFGIPNAPPSTEPQYMFNPVAYIPLQNTYVSPELFSTGIGASKVSMLVVIGLIILLLFWRK